MLPNIWCIKCGCNHWLTDEEIARLEEEKRQRNILLAVYRQSPDGPLSKEYMEAYDALIAAEGTKTDDD